MYGIYANIWGILMVNVTIYNSTMDPMAIDHWFSSRIHFQRHIVSNISPLYHMNSYDISISTLHL